ncbi:MAG: DUF2849 domain-containing protein [Deltaproteobacteria bacterium]|nr:DUF2849 domain-containing protein [Deltaproteobacteria bacterium]
MAATRPAYLVSASRLSDGAVVYLGADRRWTERFEQAARHDETAPRDEALAFAKTEEARVCNVHVVEIGVTAEGGLVLSARERFRRAGPARVLQSLGYGDFDRATGSGPAGSE